ARQHERAEARGKVENGADVDRRRLEARSDLGLRDVLLDPGTVAGAGVATVHAVVPAHHDVVEVEVYGHAAIGCVSHPPSLRGFGSADPVRANPAARISAMSRGSGGSGRGIRVS